MSIPELAQKLDAVNTADEEERKLLLQACDQLKSRLETPFDFTARLSFSVWIYAALWGRVADTGSLGPPSNGDPIGSRSKAL